MPRSWRSRVVVGLFLLAGYLALLYGVLHPAARRSNPSGPPMLTPVISEVGVRRGDALASKASPAAAVEDDSLPPATHWVFPPIDLWPNAAGRAAEVTEFTPVSDAWADPRDVAPLPQTGQQAKRRARPSTLHMVRWLRPEYRADWAAAGANGSAVLDLLIEPGGEPVELKLAQSSGSAQLDQAVLRAADLWRFAPPRWNSQPVEVWGRVELRFHER